MYRLLTQRDIAIRHHSQLRRAFQHGASKTKLTLSTPGGLIKDATVLHRADLDLWAHFGDRPDSRGLLICLLGIGKPTWQAAIEINIPVHRTLHCYGQLVADDRGLVCLAHKGGLGGGKFTVAPGPFSDLVRGFERELVQDGKQQREYYVLGRITETESLLGQIAEFVHEAHRIRQLRRNETQFKHALEALGGAVKRGKILGGSDYRGETTGSGEYWIQRRVKFERIHARVQRALANELRTRKHKCSDLRQKYGLGPDLYIKDARGRMSHLFEIKVGQDSQSTFTALGQLLVYSAEENPIPLRTIVTRGLPRNPRFRTVLRDHNITTLLYDLGPRLKVEFYELDAVLGGTSSRRTHK